MIIVFVTLTLILQIIKCILRIMTIYFYRNSIYCRHDFVNFVFRFELEFYFFIQKFIDNIFFSHLKFSTNDERFEISNEIIEKFQNYAFNQKFVVVIDFYDNKNNFRKFYFCIYHDVETQNNRKFDEHVNIAKKSNNCQRELIKTRDLNCK